MDFATIKEIVLKEKYNASDLELKALARDVEGVAKILESKGYKKDDAGTVIDLILSGQSEEEVLKGLSK